MACHDCRYLNMLANGLRFRVRFFCIVPNPSIAKVYLTSYLFIPATCWGAPRESIQKAASSYPIHLKTEYIYSVNSCRISDTKKKKVANIIYMRWVHVNRVRTG
jgi:hypothetical protein